MFTLGNKEAIVNAPSKYPITVDGTRMVIEGFGVFEQGQILSALGQRYVAEQLGSLVITCPSASDIGLAGTDKRVPVVVHIRINTSRGASEWAIDFIKRGRPLIIELNLDGSDSSTDVANKLASALNEYALKFDVAELPFTVVNDGSGALTLTTKYGHLSFQETVTFLRQNDTYGLVADTSRYVGSVQADGVTPNLLGGIEAQGETTITLDDNSTLNVNDSILIGDASNPGVEGTAVTHIITSVVNGSATDVVISPAVPAGGYVDNAIVTVKSVSDEDKNGGKYLEENVRMDTCETSGTYTISPEEKPLVSVGYTQIRWTMTADENGGIGGGWAPHKSLAIVAPDAKVGARDVTFTLYFNEVATLETGGPVDVLLTFLIGGAPSISDFKKANGEGAASVADFIA
jgi:hypothetical protein